MELFQDGLKIDTHSHERGGWDEKHTETLKLF